MSTPARKYHQSMVHYITGTIGVGDSSVTIGKVPSGATIIGTAVNVTTAFNGTTDAVTVGNSTTSDAYVAAGDVTETAAGLYMTHKGEKLSADTSVIASYSGDATAGSCDVIVMYAPDNG